MSEARFCSNCGSELTPGVTFCSSCGAQVGKPAADAPAAAPPEIPSQQPIPETPARPAAVSPAAVSPAELSGPARPTAPAPISGRTLAIIGGGIAAVVAIAGFGFFGGGGDPPVTPVTTVPGPTTTVPGPTTTVPAPTTTIATPDPPDPGTQVRDIVPTAVGDFRLVDVSDFPEAVGIGAVEGVIALYRGTGGSELELGMVLWPSEERAVSWIWEWAEDLQLSGYEVVESATIVRDGVEIGVVFLLRGGEVEWVVWSLWELALIAVSTIDNAVDFFNSF